MTRISGFGEVELAAHQARVKSSNVSGESVKSAAAGARSSNMAASTSAVALNSRDPAPQKRNKYNARKVYLDRIWFDSKAESTRYQELRSQQHHKLINDLVVHPAFPLEVDGVKIGTYRADFRYLDANGIEIVEDVKSPATAKKETFMRTKKHVLAQYSIEIRVVMR